MAVNLTTIILSLFSFRFYALADFRIGIFFEDATQINTTLINIALSQRTMIGGIHNVTGSIHIIPQGDSVTTIQKFCGDTQSVWGVIGIGNNKMISSLQRLTRSLQLPYVGILSKPHISEDTTDMINPFVQNWSAISEAVGKAAQGNLGATAVLIIFDSSADHLSVMQIMNTLSNASVALKFLRLAEVPTDKALLNYFKYKVKNIVRHFVVMTTQSNLTRILIHANASNILKQNYFWTILDINFAPSSVLPYLPMNSNVAFVRGISFPTNGICSREYLTIFGTCDLTHLRILDVQLVKNILLMTESINKVLTSTSSTPQNVDCKNQTSFEIGHLIIKKIQINYPASTAVAEVIATVSRESSHATIFERTAFSRPNRNLERTRGNDRLLKTFPNTFSGWNNKTVIFCCPAITPFINYEGNASLSGNHSINEITGMLKDILLYLAPKLDFVPIIREAADGQWGGPKDDSEYFTGCVGELQKGIVDIGGSTFTYQESRSRKIDYIFPLFEEANNVLLRLPVNNGGLWNVYRPLHPTVWATLLVTICVAALFAFLLAKFSPMSAWNLGLPFAIRDEVYIQEHLWNILGSFLQQGQDFYPYAMSSRTIMGIWWLFTLIIFSAYTADLTSFLTVKTTDVNIKSLEELAAQSAISPLVPKGTNLDSTLEDSTNPLYAKLNDKKVFADTIDGCGLMILKPENAHLACMTDYTALLYLYKKHCDQVYLFPDLFNTAPVGWIAAKDAVFMDLLKFHMQRMAEAGFIDMWFEKHWSSSGKSCKGSSTSEEAMAIDLKGVGGAYAITLSLYGAGLIALILELFWTKVFARSTADLVCFR